MNRMHSSRTLPGYPYCPSCRYIPVRERPSLCREGTSCSADTQKEIDEKVVQLVKAEHEKARKILAENREKLDELAMYLYEKETITGDEFMDILDIK